jgi:hypothetical protein
MRVLGPAMTELGYDPGLWTTGAPWKLAMFASNRVGDMDGVLVVPRAIEEEPVARA